MSLIPTYFVQSCPVCGRTLHVPIQLLGQRAACQHCRATFVARDLNGRHVPVSGPQAVLSQRVDTILNQCRG